MFEPYYELSFCFARDSNFFTAKVFFNTLCIKFGDVQFLLRYLHTTLLLRKKEKEIIRFRTVIYVWLRKIWNHGVLVFSFKGFLIFSLESFLTRSFFIKYGSLLVF